jgi:phenylacetate-CoA ligase
MNEEDLGKFCKMISAWRPTYLMGYSSALEALSKFAQTMGYDHLRFKAIRSAAEMLWPHQRKLIEETFKSPVFNFYGSREVSNLASECPEKGQLHHISTWRYIEIVNEQGDPVQNGEPGYIVVTDLSNKTMPFIRYLNEDFGMMSGGLCTCGRPSPIIDHLFGRSSDLIRTPKGDIIHGEFFTHLFYGREGIDQFQVEQSSLNEIIVRYVPNDKWRITSINEIERRIQDRVGGDVSVILEACDKIPISKSGKHRFTISKVDALEGLKKSLKGTYFGTEFA